MFSRIKCFTIGASVLLISMYSQNSFASDSGLLKLELQDAAAVGMGGAFVGESDRPSAVYYDPAGITQLDTVEASVGLTWLQPQISYKSSAVQNGAGYTANMKEDNYLFPDVFVTTPVIKDKLYIGVGESTDFGGGVDWEANSFSRYDTVKDSLTNQDYRFVAAYKINDQFSIGAGPVNDQSKFEHDVALSQSGGADGDALFKANDNAWGFDVGGMFKLNDKNQFGLNYKSPIQHQFSGTLYINGLNSSGSNYASIFGGTSFQTKAIQKMTLPQSVTLGYDFKPVTKLTINADLEWTDWSQYKQQTTYYPNLTNAGETAVLGTGNPQQRSWKSVWAESLGAQYSVTDQFRVRLGYSHHQSPVPKGTLTQFPDADSNSYTVGLGYDLTKNLTLDVAYVADVYVIRNSTNTVDNNLGAFLNGKYKAFEKIATASLTYKF